LQNGRAVEQGTHQSLTANPEGVYSALVRAQSLHLSTTDNTETSKEALKAKEDWDKVSSDEDHVAEPSVERTEQTQTTKKLVGLAGCMKQILAEQRAKWPFYLGLVVAALVAAAGTPIQALLFAKVIGVFLLESSSSLSREGSFWGLMWLALAGGVGTAYFAMGWISFYSQYHFSATYKQQYFVDMLYQKLSFFDEDDNSHGSLSARISGDAKQLEELFGIHLALAISGFFIGVGCAIMAIIFGWKLGLIALFLTMPILLASGYWRLQHEIQFDQMNAAVFMESSQFATESIGAIRTVSALTMEPAINSRYQKLLNDHVWAAQRKAQWTSVLYGFADSVTLACQALILWYGGRLMLTGEYSLEAFFVCYMAAIQGAESAGAILGAAPNAASATTAANRIMDLHDSANKNRAEQKSKEDIPQKDQGIEIELRDVHFKYPTRDIMVFEGLNLTIEKGQYIALVGPSGCGKTTIVSLLERFYDVEPKHGAILCNGVSINELGVEDYRRNLSLVPQEPMLFRGTVRDNILFGVADPDSITDERMHEVCRDAFIHDFIVSLPDGYNTDVGQKGISMSGGQKQRIAIARALIRNPKVLLLDEATSALDSESEKVIQSAFEKARHGRTMIAVAHRLSTIQSADVIYVFDDGKVIEKGSHNELVAKRGTYWEMVGHLSQHYSFGTNSTLI
jgi:ATP-binding cassette, subfamily B (MDR/TAP), member 1